MKRFSISRGRTTLYTTSSDFCRIFKEDMKSLYLLSLVLTADTEKAEQCFVAGLDDCAADNQVFKEWARTWARRVVIKNAIRTIFSDGTQAVQHVNTEVAEIAGSLAHQQTPVPAEISSLLDLPALERFAFVISVCEGYSDHDCALLLGCTRESLVAARTRAMQQIGNSMAARRALRPESTIESVDDRRGSVDVASLAQLATPA
jgi:hypothetical protein